MPLTKLALYGNTLKQPQQILRARFGRWKKDQRVNQALDLLRLLILLGDVGSELDINQTARPLIQSFLFPTNLQFQGATSQLDAFNQLVRAHRANQQHDQNHAFLIKRYGILKLFAELSENDYEKIEVLFNNAPITQQSYTDALSTLCGVLRGAVAQLNGVKAEQFTPANIYESLKKLENIYKTTQQKYNYYDYSDSFVEPELKSVLAFQVASVGLTLSAAVFFVLAIAVSNAGITAGCVAAALTCCYFVYEAIEKLHAKAQACEAKHKAFDLEMRNKLGLPEPEAPAEIPHEPTAFDQCFAGASAGVARVVSTAGTWCGRQQPTTTVEDGNRYDALNNDDDDFDDRSGAEMQKMGPG